MTHLRTALTAVVVAGLTVATALSVALPPMYEDRGNGWRPLQIWTAALWLGFALAVVLLRRVPTRAAIVLVAAGSVAIGLAAMAAPPNTSTDSARYAWDGIVQNAGISPYRYVPTDPALADLRPEWLFPKSVDGGCPTLRIMESHEPDSDRLVCTAINRATVPTIYPPTAELLFAGERLVVGPDAEYWPMQLVGLLASLGITAMLLTALVRRGRDPRWAALWGWCPLVATEAVTNGHVDVVAALLLLAATLMVSSGRRVLGGVALGLSIATKLIPVIGAPALLGRKPWALIGSAVGTFVLLYVPYVIQDGPRVIGYLPGYLNEEGYDTGGRSILFSLVAPGIAATVLAGLVILATAVIVWRRSEPSDPWVGEVVMIGVTLLAISPRYAWYALLLVPMIAMSGRWEWLVVPLALTERLLYAPIWVGRLTLALAVVLLVLAEIRRAGQGSIPAGWARLTARVFGARRISD